MDTTPTDREATPWMVAVHLSLLAGYIIPFGGFIVPIVIWQLKKHEVPGLDAHGRVVANWLITSLVFAAVSWLLCLVLIGIPMLWTLAVVGVAFPIIGAVKAGDGRLWSYPGSMPIF